MIETAATTGVVMIMMFCIMLLSRIYIMESVLTMILEQLYRISKNRYAILFLLNIFMIIIGMVMDDVSAMLLCTPILLPVMTQICWHPSYTFCRDNWRKPRDGQPCPSDSTDTLLRSPYGEYPSFRA